MNLKISTKRAMSIFFMFILLFSCVWGSVVYGDGNGSGLLRNGTVEGFADGEGTSTNPWIIETPEQLTLVRNYLGASQ